MNGTYADLAGQAGLAVVERFVDLVRMHTHLLNWCLEGVVCLRSLNPKQQSPIQLRWSQRTSPELP